MLKTTKSQFRNYLELIDIKNNKDCWFQNGYSVFYKTPTQLLNNQSIIEKISPNDACILGVVCGETYELNFENNIPITNNFASKRNHYSNESNPRILSISRNGYVEIMDVHLEKKGFDSIVKLAQEKSIICNFSSEDSFYIGFLAGIELYKIKTNLHIKPKNKVNLKLVYSR